MSWFLGLMMIMAVVAAVEDVCVFLYFAFFECLLCFKDRAECCERFLTTVLCSVTQHKYYLQLNLGLQMLSRLP